MNLMGYLWLPNRIMYIKCIAKYLACYAHSKMIITVLIVTTCFWQIKADGKTRKIILRTIMIATNISILYLIA